MLADMTRSAPSSTLGPLARAAVRSRWFDKVLQWRAADILRKTALDRHLPESGTFLDIGSGFGHLAEAVLRAAGDGGGCHGSEEDGGGGGRRHRRCCRRCSCSCVALDPIWSPPPPLAARLTRPANGHGSAAGGGRVRALHADGTSLPFTAGSFDAAWCAFVLHHLAPDAQERLLAEAARVLRPGAIFVLIEDTPIVGATLRADRRLNFENRAAPHHYRSPDEWRAALRAHGLAPAAEEAFTAVFPRATLRRVPHRSFVCRRQ